MTLFWNCEYHIGSSVHKWKEKSSFFKCSKFVDSCWSPAIHRHCRESNDSWNAFHIRVHPTTARYVVTILLGLTEKVLGKTSAACTSTRLWSATALADAWRSARMGVQASYRTHINESIASFRLGCHALLRGSPAFLLFTSHVLIDNEAVWFW